MSEEAVWPQAGRIRMIVPAPVGVRGTEVPNPEPELLARLDAGHVMMMGDNPALPRMPARPRLLDFFQLRFQDVTARHLLVSAGRALDEGQDEKVVMACLLHDISNGCLIRCDHGYWGAQMIAPYVDEEVAWAVRYHQALRFFPDPKVGYEYPQAYIEIFGKDYKPEPYICADYEYARAHKWYGTSRMITLNDLYAFDPNTTVDLEVFADIVGRRFRQPKEGLGFDNSPVAHMWRAMIWPRNFL
jgi:HD domain